MAEAKFGKMGAQLKHGYNSATICESNMMMDIGIQVMSAGEKLTFNEQAKEVAYVILTGEVKISWENNIEVMKRTSLFDENPSCLHVPLATEVTIEAVVDSEVLIQKTENDTKFAPKFYHPEDVQADVFGGGVWSGTATRTVRTIFDYENAPYSNMVMVKLSIAQVVGLVIYHIFIHSQKYMYINLTVHKVLVQLLLVKIPSVQKLMHM